MGVLKLSVINEQEKARKKSNVAHLGKDKIYHVSACGCPCECFINKGQIRMDVGETASWNID